MARIELTENRGPEVIDSFVRKSVADASQNYGDVVNVRLFTIHSYQIMYEAGSSSPVTYKILGSNYTDPTDKSASSDFSSHWTTIHSGMIDQGDNLAICDVWNFKYSCVHFSGASSGKISVYEKHNV